MRPRHIVKIIGFLEFIIGISTLFTLMVFSWLAISKKPPNVFIFVLISSIASSVIGLELLGLKHWAVKALLLFSLYIVLTKILLFAHILEFTGEVMTWVPTQTKDYISFLYHILLLILFTRPAVKKVFTG